MLWLAEAEYEQQMITKILHSGLLDGVIVSSMVIDDPIVGSLHESKMPFVLIGRHPTLDIQYVDVDNEAGGYQATIHLVNTGYKRIATIAGPQNLIAGYDRLQGYKRALQESNFPIDLELIVAGDFSEKSGYEACLKLIPKKPEAIFVGNDTMSMGAFRAIREAGLKVPEDIAIIGYDDIPNASSNSIPLTTIRQPIQELGQEAVKGLIEIIHSPESPQKNNILKTELVIRKSSGSTGSRY